MILFDALSGNNDRHYYNWGVISHVKNEHSPYFSPVYDTARGLFWNNSDENVLSLHKELTRNDKTQLQKYVVKSVPKISIPSNANCNHFDLIQHLHLKSCFNKKHIDTWTNKDHLKLILDKLHKDFGSLFIKERRDVIQYILETRFNKISEILLK